MSNIESLMRRVDRAQDFLEKYIAEEMMNDKERSIQSFRMAYEIIDIYLKVARFWLANGYVTYEKTLIRPPTNDILTVAFYEEGQPIVDRLRVVEAIIEALKNPAIDESIVTTTIPSAYFTYDDGESSPEIPLAQVTLTKKRSRDDDSGVDLPTPPKRKRVKKVVIDDDSDDERQLSSKSSSLLQEPQFPAVKAEAEPDLDETADDSEHSDFEDGDDDDEEDEHDDEFLMSGALVADPTSLQALAATPEPKIPAPKKRGRPPKINTTIANLKRDDDFSPRSPNSRSPRSSQTARPTFTPHAAHAPFSAGQLLQSPKSKKPQKPADSSHVERPEDVWPPIQYNGRPRPKDMPHLPCPEGINPRSWYGLSYLQQQQRMEGLQQMADMPSEASDWDTSSDEEDSDEEELWVGGAEGRSDR